MDLCCGDGLFTAALAQVSRRVVAIDLDAELLARARVATAGAVNCEFVVGDASALPDLVGGPVDLVFLANTLHGVPDKGRVLEVIASVLRAGGRLAVMNWHSRPRDKTVLLGQPRGPATELRMTPAQVADAIGFSGLRLVRVVDLPPFHYGAVLEKPNAPFCAGIGDG